MRPSFPERARSASAVRRDLGRAALCVASALASACGGPSVPAEVPSASALSPEAEPAPLPTIGSSFVDTPLSPEQRSGGGHAGHGAHGHPGHAGHGVAAPQDAGVADDAGAPAPHHHRGHDHAR